MKYIFDLSIIIPTINNPFNLKKLLRLIDNQNIFLQKKIEVIIIYQGNLQFNNKLKLKNINKIRILNQKKKSLSYAKNLGMRVSKGLLVSFLDDDIIIGKKYLINIFLFFKKNKNIDIVFGSIKLKKKKLFYSRYMNNIESKINFLNLKKCLASAMIYKKNAKQLKFDERFGLGAPYPSSEETDLIFNCLIKKKFEIKYYPKIDLIHPDDEILNEDLKQISKKFFSYGIGTGAVYAKYMKKNYIFIILYLYELAKSVIGICLSILRLNRFLLQKHVSILSGKILGFLRFSLSQKNHKI